MEAHKPSTISAPTIVIHFITPRKVERSKVKAKAAATAAIEELQKNVEEGERRIAETRSLKQTKEEMPNKRVELNRRARAVNEKRALIINHRQGRLEYFTFVKRGGVQSMQN
ncbi:unnamed protein product [Cylicostephanus goldi]|uniref:Uncharacterized protein n=1 Tax=Cylicostephanus goldi TaxID=71465 RepID=A0A3P6UP20_CYLGO|nr:unnamed protein product [Cylicostephanus goldi]